MPDNARYKKIATVYVREDEKKKPSKSESKPDENGKVYNALDKLEKLASVAALINRIILGDPNPKSKHNKKKRKQIKKYAKINKKKGVLVLKKAKKTKKAKKAKKNKSAK